LGGHFSGVIAFDPQGNAAVVWTGGVGGGFAIAAGGAGGVTIGYIRNATSVFELGGGNTITSSIGGGDGIGGSVSTDLEGNPSLTVGGGAGITTSSTLDFSKSTILVCHK
jgi:hypothetical protein